MTITRITHFEAAEGKAPALREFLKRVNAAVTAAPGCQGCQLIQDPGNPRRLAVMEQWDKIESHQAAAKAIPPEMVAEVMPLLAGQPAGNYYEVVD